MTKKPGSGSRPTNRPRTRAPVGHHEKVQGADERLARKKRLTERHASDRRPNGLVEIPGPIETGDREEMINLARNLEAADQDRGRPGKILSISDFEGGLAIETEDEKLAQRIADAVSRAFHGTVERVYDDEGRRRILTCHLRDAGGK